MKVFFNYIRSESLRIVIKPTFIFAIIGIAIIRFIDISSSPEFYDIVIKLGLRDSSILHYCNMWDNDSFLSYVMYSLAALPVVSNYLEDCKSGRISMLLTRVSKIKYVFGQIIMLILITNICTIAGSIIFMIITHLIYGVPFANEIESHMESDVLENGHTFLYWLLKEMQNGMQAAFYGFLALGASLVIKDTQFIIVLPMIVRYIFVYFINEDKFVWIPNFLSPKNVYIYMYSYRLFLDNDLLKCGYSILFTLCIAVCVGFFMHRRLRKEL